jgi:hypothetical protein
MSLSNHKSVAEAHANWAKITTPPGVSDIQRREMEKAFYSGYFSAMKWCTEAITEMSDNDGSAAISARLKELDDYFGKLISQRHNHRN